MTERVPIERVVSIHNLYGLGWSIVYKALPGPDGHLTEIDVDEMFVQRMFEDGDFLLEEDPS